MDEALVKSVELYVRSLLKEKLPAWAVYHTVEHTEETVTVAEEIAEASHLSPAELEIVRIAAWFHDTGYTEIAEGHEERSASFARTFLERHGYAEDNIRLVEGCIMATRVPQKPNSLLEQVVADADLAHLGRKRFFDRSDLMRFEFEMRRGHPFSEAEWLRTNVEFVSAHEYHTPYARKEFSGRRLKNLMKLQDRMREVDGARPEPPKQQKKALARMEKEKIPERGIETMFRTVPKNHLDLSSMADSKANIMLSTSSIIISILFSLLASKLDTNPHLIIPTVILLAVCLATMILAILTTRPTVSSGTFTREDIEKKRANLLFFGNFHNTPLADFEWGMKEMMKDREYLYGSMIRDLYYLGRVVGRKYRYLRICYTVFMYGIIVSAIAFAIAMIAAAPAAPPPVIH